MIALDLPPKLPLWTPPKPAIIRAADVPRSEIDRLFDAGKFGALGMAFAPGFRGGAPVTPGIDSYTKLLLHCENTTDVAGSHTVTATGATVSSSQAKFGSSSFSYNGSGQYHTITSDSNLVFGTGDFTVELWFYLNSNATEQALISCRNTGDSGNHSWILKIGGTQNCISFHSDSAGIFDQSTGAFSATTWNHVAATRSGSTLRIFLNGAKISSDISNSMDLSSTNNYRLGKEDYPGTGVGDFNGYIDEVRFSKGIARWTANFTPPTKLYG